MRVVLDDVERLPADGGNRESQAERFARDRRVLRVFALLMVLPGLAGFLLAVFS